MYLDSLIKEECCGCSACFSICPVMAISMKPDEDEFLYPTIDNHICIQCNKCRCVCPMEKPTYTNTSNPQTIAAYSETERQKSSSGGLFYMFAQHTITNGGSVYGAAFDKHLHLSHKRVDNIDDLIDLRGSKYLQSNLDNTYQQVLQDLNLQKTVYFTGTPCQVAGLKSFLQSDDTNLYTSDLVCHGVPSQWLFNQHIVYLETKYGGSISNYQFRNNKEWGGCEIFDFTNPNGKIKTICNPTYELSPYLYSFMYAMTYRPSCYHCPFAKIPRQGDITLADFWGVQKCIPDIDSSKGVSLVLINNNKGESLWKSVRHDCIYHESRLSDAVLENGNIIHPSSKPHIRETIYPTIRQKGYAFVAKKYFRSPKHHMLRLKVMIKSTATGRFIIQTVKQLKHN